MSDTAPTPPDGWSTRRTSDDHLRYDTDDRRASVICYPVKTASGDGFNCRLFVSDAPYTTGDPRGAEFAPTEAATPTAVETLTTRYDL